MLSPENEDCDNHDESKEATLPSDYISKPKISEKSTISLDILSFNHSYGYRCKMEYNLSVVGGKALIFIAGNIITFIDIQNKIMKFRRSAMGGGIGFICSNTTTSHFAVGEKGLFPPIIVFEWPSLKVDAILRNGTAKAFTYLCFSHDGSLLCSQGSAPDFFLTVWNWKEEQIILQYQSIGQVSKCIFSQYNPDVLVTVGNGYIKFWKIVKTFSGLKLEGESGKFDKTSPTNMIALLPMPQGMFLTGCEWGNMLLWNWNAIQFEISKRSPKTCHSAPITTIFYDDASDRLLTLGMDGCIKVWSYGPIQKTETSEEMHTLGCLPIDEYEMETPAAFLSSVKQFPNDPSDDSWIVQDAKGAIWRMNLSVKNECTAEECLFRAPAGKIVGLTCSPTGCAFAALSEEGGLYIYDYRKKILLGYKLFSGRGASLMWIPIKVDLRGNKLLLGFQSGVIRLVSISYVKSDEKSSDDSEMQEQESSNEEEEIGSNEEGNEGDIISTFKSIRSKRKSFWTQRQKRSSINVSESIKFLDKKVKLSLTDAGEIDFCLQQVIKPHKKSVSAISHNLNFSLFVTASEDGSVFFYDVLRKDRTINLNPIGFVQVGNPVTCVDWMPSLADKLLVCCSRGQLTEVIFSQQELKTKEFSYELNTPMKHNFFKSKKSKILQDICLKNREAEKIKKRERKEKELEMMKEKNGGKLDVDPEIYVADSEEEEELDPLYIPEIPNEILFGYYSECGNVKISVGGYDCGYIYEYNFESEDVTSWSTVEGIQDVEATCFAFSPNRKYLILGMDDGNIMVIALKADNTTDFSDYWVLPMHDGAVRKLSFSSDFQMLFSCGDDGNIFSYNCKEMKVAPLSEDSGNTFFLNTSSHGIPIRDILDDEKMLSLEEVRQQEKQEKERKMNEAEKELVLNQIKGLQKRFDAILERNSKLPPSEQFTDEDFELHPELTKLTQSIIDEKMESIYKKYEFDLKKSQLELDKRVDYFLNCLETLMPTVSSLRGDTKVEGFRLRKIPDRFYKAKEMALKKLSEQSSKFRVEKEEEITTKVPPKSQQTFATFETIINSLLPLGNVDLSKMRVQVIRAMEKYVKCRQEMEKRAAEWDALLSSKPSDKNNDKMDMKAIEEAKLTIGDYTLKTSPNYRVPPHLRMTTVKKYHQLLEAHLLIHNKKQEFNGKVNKLVEKKASLAAYVKKLSSEHELVRGGKLAEYELLLSKTDETASKLKDIMQERTKEPPKFDDFFLLKYHKLKKSLEEEIDWLAFPVTITDSSDSESSAGEGRKKDYGLTPLEKEMAAIKRKRVLHNTKIIEDAIAEEINLFDEEVTSLKMTKSKLDFDLNYLECYAITLQEELLIIKEFEAQEEILTEKVQDKLLEENKMIEKIHDIEGKIEARKQKVEDLEDQQNNIIANFDSAITNSTASLVLKKIFKKKYKPPKIKSENDSSEEESSSSESSTDTSYEGDEFVLPVKIDETICPEGCAPELFELTLSLRNQRHKVEEEIKEEKEQLDMLKKDLEMSNKNLKSIENAYQKCDEELGVVLMEKQKQLNDLQVVVVLKLSQIQQMTSTDDLRELSKYVLFSKEKLNKLHARTKELEDECEDQIKKHRLLQKHVHHLNVDRKFMKERIAQLKEELHLKMEKKFGKVVDITKLQHAVLHKYLLEAQNQFQEVKDAYEKEYASWQHQLRMKQNKLTEVIAANTEKKSLLAALQEEKTKLDKYLKNQAELSNSPLEDKLDSYLSDVENLMKIKMKQEKEIETLREEIMKLSRKTKHGALPPLDFSKPSDLHEDDEEIVLDDLFTFKTEMSDFQIDNEEGCNYDEESSDET